MSRNSGEEYIVEFTAADTDFNTTSREEYVFIKDLTAQVINQYILYSSVTETISVGVDVSDNSGRVVANTFLYWKAEPNNEHDSWGILLTNGVGNITFTDITLKYHI